MAGFPAEGFAATGLATGSFVAGLDRRTGVGDITGVAAHLYVRAPESRGLSFFR